MENVGNFQTRKKFISLGITGLSLLTALRFFVSKKSKKPTTIKMLTQDGKLVEVDEEAMFRGRRQNISDEQLKNWVTRK